MTLSGWVCPVCGEANAPWNTVCAAGPHRKMVTTNTTSPPWCITCGEYMSPGAIHSCRRVKQV